MFAPNVYVSVLAVRGRVTPFRSWLGEKLGRRSEIPWRADGIYETALVDLAKPAWKLGVASVRVG